MSHPAAANKILQSESFAGVEPLPYLCLGAQLRHIPQRVEFPFRHSILLTHYTSHPRHSFELIHSFGLRRTVYTDPVYPFFTYKVTICDLRYSSGPVVDLPPFSLILSLTNYAERHLLLPPSYNSDGVASLAQRTPPHRTTPFWLIRCSIALDFMVTKVSCQIQL